MQKKSLTILDFDVAMELAEADPAAFEQYRKDVIEALIARAPEKNRHHLRCLQWRIDQERERASNPFAACIKLYRMMWDSFAGERGLVDALRNGHQTRQSASGRPYKAEVVSLSTAVTSETSSES